MYTDVYFDQQNITEINNVNITDVTHDTIPSVIITSEKISRNHGTKLFNKEYGNKKIIVEGYISSSSRDEYFIARRELLKILNKNIKTLQVPNSPQPLEFQATVENIIFKDSGGGYGNFTIIFLCTDPFGYYRDTVVLLNAYSNTSATASITLIEQIDSIEPSPAYFRIAYTAITGGTTDKVVTIESQAGESISVTRDWTTGDVLEIDMKEKTVKINGVLNDYSGIFWNFRLDQTNIEYTDNFSTRTAVITITYRQREV